MKEESGIWYHQRKPPVFCNLCLPFYEVIYPARLIILVISFVLWVGGVLILIGTFIACVAAICEPPVYSSLIPLAILFMVIGYCLFHCAWASYLLDEPDANVYIHREPEEIVVSEPEPGDHFVAREGVGPTLDEEGTPIASGPLDPKKYGHWKFVPDDAWQNKCSLDTLQ